MQAKHAPDGLRRDDGFPARSSSAGLVLILAANTSPNSPERDLRFGPVDPQAAACNPI